MCTNRGIPVPQNMNALHSARQNITEKVRRDPIHHVCTYADMVYTNGDKVYYHSNNFKEQKDQTVVFGKDAGALWKSLLSCFSMLSDEGVRQQ